MTYSPQAFPVQVPQPNNLDWGRWGARDCTKTETGWRGGDVSKVWWDPNGFRQQRGENQHNSMDLMAPIGATIVAARSGRVMGAGEWRYNGESRDGAGWSDRGGWYVRLIPDDGGTDYYAHMVRRPEVQSGQYVRAGEVLGYVGQTGSARNSCPHLHYQVKSASRRYVDPEPAQKALFDRGGWELSAPTLSPRNLNYAKMGGAVIGGLLAFALVKRFA